MPNQKNSKEVTLTDIKKSLDRLAFIEFCKAGASTQQIREVMGPVDNNQISKIRQAVKKNAKEE